MTWVKLDDQFSQHPKIVAAGPTAGWLYVCALTYSARYLTDGFIPERQAMLLADISDPYSEIERLLAVGLFERTDGGYRIHDYLDYNPPREQVLAERAAAKQRMGNVRQKFSRSSGEQSANKTRTSGSPYPVPDPNPNPLPFPSNSAHAEGVARKRAGPRGSEPDRYAQVEDLLRISDPSIKIHGQTSRNRRAVNDSQDSIRDIAEAYIRLKEGLWQDEHVQSRGDLVAVVQNLGGFLVQKPKIDAYLSEYDSPHAG
jgi:hypothetical protein